MEEGRRKRKQALIAGIFFLIVGGLGFLIYRGIYPPPPSPTPNPTINLAPIEVINRWLFNVENNDYDFLVKVANPNTDYGSPNVEYELIFFNSAGAQISKKTGSFYILPGQVKYVADLPLKFQEPISRVDFAIRSVDWQKLSPLAATGVNLVVKNYENSYVEVQQPGVFSKAGGKVLNDSDFDLDRVDVVVVLFDENGTPLGVNKTVINTFLAKTIRGFEAAWPSPFVGKVARVDAEANTNVFENSNFLRQYGGQEKFKQMY
jgi:hypothetical protein